MNLATLFDHKKIVFSLEIFPPKTDTSYNAIYNTLLRLRGIPADFISVTYGQGGTLAQREKTVEMASLIRTNYHIEPVAHLTCLYLDESEARDLLTRLQESGVQNIMVLRGDINAELTPKTAFKHASDLAGFIRNLGLNFNMLGACYPESHYESESLERDVEALKHKVENGVSQLVTQLFFDNEHFYRFRDLAASKGIDVPISAGIMPITSLNQIERTVALSGASVPQRLSHLFSRYANNPKALRDAGIHYAIDQIIDLIEHDVRGIHLYTMNSVDTATRISDAVQNILEAENQRKE